MKIGWLNSREISTLNDNSKISCIDFINMDKDTKDKLAKAAIFGTGAVATAAINILVPAFGGYVDRKYIAKMGIKAREQAWNEYQRSGDIIKALESLFGSNQE